MKYKLIAFFVAIAILSSLIYNSLTLPTGIIEPEDSSIADGTTGIIKIGVLLPLTGDDSVEGNKELLAIEYAHFQNPYVYIDDVLYEVELVILDTKSDPGQLLVSARQMIHNGIFAILGTSEFEESNELMNYLQTEESVILIGTTAPKNVDEPSSTNHFTVAHQDSFQGTMLANYCIESKYQRVAVVSQQNSSQHNLMESAIYYKSAIEAYGGEIVFDQEYAAEDLNYIISEIKTINPDVIFLGLDSVNGRELLQQLKAENITIPVVATDRILNSTFELNYAEGITVFQYFDERDVSNDDVTFFAEDFREYVVETDETTNALAKNNNTLEIDAEVALAYDAYNSFIYAADIVKEDDDLTLNVADFATALHMVDYMGATGRIYFDIDGTVVRNAGYVNTIVNGVPTFVKKQYVGNSYQDER